MKKYLSNRRIIGGMAFATIGVIILFVFAAVIGTYVNQIDKSDKDSNETLIISGEEYIPSDGLLKITEIFNINRKSKINENIENIENIDESIDLFSGSIDRNEPSNDNKDNSDVVESEETGGATEIDEEESGIEYIDVRDFGALGDGSTYDTVAIQAAVDSGVNILIPETDASYYITGDIYIRDEKNILLEGTISGTGSFTVAAGDGDVSISGSGIISDNTYIQVVSSGNCTISSISFLNTSRLANILIASDLDGVDSILISNTTHEDSNYGILRNRVSGENNSQISGIKILSNNFYNLKGDAIEMNGTISNDNDIEIAYNTIDLVDSTEKGNTFWGIGIGVAGGYSYNDDYSMDRFSYDIYIHDNVIKNVRLGIHIEKCANILIENNTVEVDSQYSQGVYLMSAGIETVGCQQFTINNNQVTTVNVSYGIITLYGVKNDQYLMPCINYSITNNTVNDGKIISDTGWQEGFPESTVEVSGNYSNMGVIHKGSCNLVFNDNIGYSSDESDGIMVDFYRIEYSNKDSYQQEGDYSIQIMNNSSLDDDDNPASATIINLPSDVVTIEISDNNFK